MKKEDNEEKLVHQDSMHENNEPYLGKPVKFKNRLWVIKDIKDNEVIEIEAPYSRRVKMHLLMDVMKMKIHMKASTDGCYWRHLLMVADEDEKDQHLLMDADEKDLHLLMDAM
ncbi:hypothetical protein LR48_Vigan05g123500 [Vigna angularis]|uniref:Uncharacterized protein n=1 Tax=Phaseolus angularis TaxID=3914 RepID=A0A0L9UL57_PHAAN|nr:hypothetical protein LR48_Vigan05g123500 [Vigna angularis]